MSTTLSSIRDKFGEAILDVIEFRGEDTVIVEKAQAHDILKYCCDDLGFDYLVDISSIDFLG